MENSFLAISYLPLQVQRVILNYLFGLFRQNAMLGQVIDV